MPDDFANHAPGLSGPAERFAAITPNDGADLAFATRALYIGGSGDVSIVSVGGSTVTFSNVQSGSVLPVRAARVRSTGTTATLIIGMR